MNALLMGLASPLALEAPLPAPRYESGAEPSPSSARPARMPLAKPLTLDFSQAWVLHPAKGQELLGLSGLVVLWSEARTTLPAGWVYCDGQHGSPNLVGAAPAGAHYIMKL